MARHCPVLLCTCKLHKSSCKCQTCLLPSQRDSGRSEKRWSEGVFVHCAQPHRASDVCMLLLLGAEISLERGHLKRRQKSSRSELCIALAKFKGFETEGAKKKSMGKDFSFLSCSFVSPYFSFILILSLFAIATVIVPTEVGFG